MKPILKIVKTRKAAKVAAAPAVVVAAVNLLLLSSCSLVLQGLKLPVLLFHFNEITRKAGLIQELGYAKPLLWALNRRKH